MSKTTHLTAAIAVMFALTACEELPQPTDGADRASVRNVNLDKGPWSSFSGHWTQKSNDYEVRFTVRNLDGRVAVCGVQFDGTQNLRNLQTRLMRDLQVYVGDTKLVQGMDHFPKVEDVRARDLQAPCKITDVPWASDYGDNKKWEVKRRGDGSYRL